jgi:large subunit ribosomal protein L15
MGLETLRPPAGATHHKKRLGAGTGSGHGKTAGRGTKGQRARRRGEYTLTFEGGQTPFVKRQPYRRGFRNALFKKRFEVIDLDTLEKLPEGVDVSLESLTAMGILRPRLAGLGPFMGLKVLGSGTLTKKMTVHAARFSKSARARIEELGGIAHELGEHNLQPKQF